MADELTRALGLLAAHGVLQLTQSAAKAEPQQVAVNLHFASQVGCFTNILPVLRCGQVNKFSISKQQLHLTTILQLLHQHPQDKPSIPIQNIYFNFLSCLVCGNL